MNRFITSSFLALSLAILTMTAFAAEPAAQPPASGAARVAVLAFTPSGPDSQPWISDALQRALVADLSRLSTLAPISLDKPNDDAVASSGARYVVT